MWTHPSVYEYIWKIGQNCLNDSQFASVMNSGCPSRVILIDLDNEHVPKSASRNSKLVFTTLQYISYIQVSINISNISCTYFLWTYLAIKLVTTPCNRSHSQHPLWFHQVENVTDQNFAWSFVYICSSMSAVPKVWLQLFIHKCPLSDTPTRMWQLLCQVQHPARYLSC
jgi:hypothetical protein